MKAKGKIVESWKIWEGKIEKEDRILVIHVHVLNGKVSEVVAKEPSKIYITDGYVLKEWERDSEILRQIADHIDAAIEASKEDT